MLAWLEAHPVLVTIFTLFLLPLLGAILNWIFWFESDDAWKAYALEHPKRAQWIRLGRAMFPHLRKAFPALKDILPPSGPAAVLLLLLLAWSATGCTPSRSAADVTRDVVRGAVLVATEAIPIADEVCAGIARTAQGSGDEAALRRGIEIAQTCARAKDAGLVAAKAARMAINSWGSASAGQLACAGAQLGISLNLTRDAIVRGGGDVPPIVEDGIAAAAMLSRMLPIGASCELSTPGAT